MRRPAILPAAVLVCFGLAGSARVAHGDWVYWDPALGGNGHYYMAVASWNDWDQGPWLGGLQPPGSPEPGGGWRWVTGEAFSYSNWHPLQPNNDPSENQDRIHMARPGYPIRGATWNDLDGTRLLVSYVVEAPGPSLPAPDFDTGWRECGPPGHGGRAVVIRHDLGVAGEQLTIKTLFHRENFRFGQVRYPSAVVIESRDVLVLDLDSVVLVPGCDHTMTQYRVQIWANAIGVSARRPAISPVRRRP